MNGAKEVDYTDVAGDAFTAPGLNALVGGGIDIKPFAERSLERYRIQGIYNSKPAGQFGTDAAIIFGFGKLGDAAWKPLAPFTKSAAERNAFYLSTQMSLSVGQEGAGKITGGGDGK